MQHTNTAPEQAPPSTPPPLPPRCRPWSEKLFLLAGIVLLEAAVMFTLSGVDYREGDPALSLVPTGWFVLGQFMILPASLGYAMAFNWLGKRLGRPVGWTAMLAVSAVLVATAAHSARPQAHLAMIVGQKAAGEVRLVRLRGNDSFNAGMFYSGMLIASDQAWGSIVECRPMDFDPAYRNPFFDGQMEICGLDPPENGRFYEGRKWTFYRAPNSEEVYFIYRTRTNVE